MKKSILTTILILGIAAGEFSCIAQAKMTKLQKKENYLINVANSGMDSKQYDIAVEYYTKVLEINPQNATQLLCDGTVYQVTSDTVSNNELGSYIGILAENVI